MIDRAALLADLKPLVIRLTEDLRQRCESEPQKQAALKAEWAAAKEANRTADSYNVWRDGKGKLSGRLTEVAAAWVLATVFVRFLEDNDLVSPPRLSGPGDRLGLAADHQQAYFKRFGLHNDREYLESVFDHLSELPALDDILGRKRNPLWTLDLSQEGAKELIAFWRKRDVGTGDVRHDFTDPLDGDGGWETRFLGDLYQDLSEAAKKRYALLQTPEFIEEFILDRTLDPACREFGYREVKLIDPACGSGHFLLGAFERLYRRWAADEPDTNPPALARRALDAVNGVDINPFAVAIARFRLLVAALRVSGVRRLTAALDFHPRVATGDSLVHGPRPNELRGLTPSFGGWLGDAHVFCTEDKRGLAEILGQRYHVVVGNPPYITVKDKAQSAAIRARFGSCRGKYALSVPFMERLFDLALEPDRGDVSPAGFVGQITSNSFMTREFGKTLIERYIPKWDVSHVIDVSGAYVPGHGTPTVILIGRHRTPSSPTVRAVMGIRGEPSTPLDPAHGRVWTAICAQVDHPGSESEFASVDDVPRQRFATHPWSLQGGGAVDLRELLEARAARRLREVVASIGYPSFPGLDDAFIASRSFWRRVGVPTELVRPFVTGDVVRDFDIRFAEHGLAPYDDNFDAVPLSADARWAQHLWRYRASLERVVSFGGKTRKECGDDWWVWYRWIPEKYRTPLSIAFAFVATHNHFVVDRGGAVFKQTAPVIKLPSDASETEHVALSGLLNSSVACFWMKQVMFNKGDSTDKAGARTTGEVEFNSYEFASTRLLDFPVTTATPTNLARAICDIARERDDPDRILRRDSWRGRLVDELDAARRRDESATQQMISLQEELDWLSYEGFEICDQSLAPGDQGVPGIERGQRPFEIVMARKMAAGELSSRWFSRDRSTPTTEIPSHWPADYRDLVRRRIAEMEHNKSIRLIEQPQYKRRWKAEPWRGRQDRVLREWLLDRLEGSALWSEPELQSVARLADRASSDPEFLEVAEVYVGKSGFDMTKLVEKLTRDEAAPFLAAHRYKPSGLRKRSRWEETWKLQRQEDAIDARSELEPEHPRYLSPEQAAAEKAAHVSDIPVPPKYASGDFLQTSIWRLRGKLDVPKERFISYPGAEREADPTTVLGWGGWDHLERTQALVAYYQERRERESWPEERFIPLLAGVLEQVPWLLQWHNDPDEYDQGAGDAYRNFVEEEARALGVPVADLAKWEPPKKTRGRKRKNG